MFITEGQTLNITDMTNEKEGYVVTKWSNVTDAGETASNTAQSGVNTDFPLFRLADVYLMYAEATAPGRARRQHGSGLQVCKRTEGPCGS